jgi:hypothetical protein
MGHVPHTRDVPRYARMFGTEPELDSDAPAWVIQLAGRVDFGDNWADNPVCMVVDGHSTIFTPETYGGVEGFKPNESIAPAPNFSLPPLDP